ncbi:RNA polymerase-binding transcription factor [Salmonella enterica subsp. enterica serovar Saintpaul]|nr:RNA polymerase-binding transcription factor [Salmonella enterica subsp. enterica serovar Saintpaul]
MQEGQNRKTSSLSILAIAGVEPYQEKPGEEYMNEAQLSHFKRILEAWRNQLRDEVDRTVTHMQDEAANFPDPVDRAAQEEEFSLELRNRDRERKLIKKIEKTLKKVEDEDFGYCESCGVEIGIRRLEARPTADLCIDCKTLAEIREKQMAGYPVRFYPIYDRREFSRLILYCPQHD